MTPGQPSPSFLPPEDLKGVTLGSSEEAADLPASVCACGQGLYSSRKRKKKPRWLPYFFSQEPPGLQVPRLYEIIAFCPAFNANRTGEIRSEQRSSFMLKARLGLCWGQKARGVPFKSKKMETKR